MAALNHQTVQDAVANPTQAQRQALIYHPPADAPERNKPAVVHLGLGGFHRAHQAMVFDELLAKGDQRWGVCAVGMRSAQLSTQLRAQDYLYLVRISDAQGSRWHAPSSIVKTLVAASERDAVIEQIASPHTRWITLTVTEKAYTPALAGLIVDGLAARQAKGLAGLTIASCDNLPDNGRVLGALCQAQAANPPFDPSLQSWIETECRFPSSMVDRIVPAPSAEVRAAALQDLGLDDPSALGVEGFWEWVIEDSLVEPADADALRSVGVVVTDDVAGFEQAKLWMLNASHTVLASIGAVLGDRFIRQVIARPVVRQWVHAYMTHASGPLVGRPNWQDYRDALIERFGNPMLDHACLQVYSDSSLKIPVRWVPVGQRLLDKVAGDRANTNALDASRLGLDCLAVAVAIFVRSLDPVTEAGEPFVFNDPLASELQALARDQRADPRATIGRLLAPADQGLALLGERLGEDSVFLASAAHWLGRIHARGIESALQEFVQ